MKLVVPGGKKSSKGTSIPFSFRIRVYPIRDQLYRSLKEFIEKYRWEEDIDVPVDWIIDKVEVLIEGLLVEIFIDHIQAEVGISGPWKPVSFHLRQFRELVRLWNDAESFGGGPTPYQGPSSITLMKPGVRSDDKPFDYRKAKEEIRRGLNVRFVKSRNEIRDRLSMMLRSKIVTFEAIDEIFDYWWYVPKIAYSTEFETRFGKKVFIQDLAHSGFYHRQALSKKDPKKGTRRTKPVTVSGYAGKPKHRGSKGTPMFVFPATSGFGHATMGGMSIAFSSHVSGGGFTVTPRPYLYLSPFEERRIIEEIFRSVINYLRKR